MMNYTSYERVKAALEHKESDRIPFDLGGSLLTGAHRKFYVNLRKYLGMSEKEPQIVDRIQQLAKVDDDVVKRLNIDVRYVEPDPPAKKRLAKDIIRDGDYYKMTDEFGIVWRMPVDGGHYFDMLKGPLKDADSVEQIEQFPWNDPCDDARFATMKQRADKIVNEEKRAYILGRHYAGIWETAFWLNGFEKFFMDMALNKKFVHALMEKVTELKMQYWGKSLETVEGESFLIVSEADDLATQHSLLCSPKMYKEMVYPYHKQLFNFIKEKTKTKVYLFYHSCGAMKPFIPYLIEAGVDILNPIQVSAEGMDTKELKKEFGQDISFWGGGVDTQYILPFGTPQEVRDEVKRRIDDLAPGGGFVFAAVHNVQGDVPPENFMAMWETLQEYGMYVS